MNTELTLISSFPWPVAQTIDGDVKTVQAVSNLWEVAKAEDDFIRSVLASDSPSVKMSATYATFSRLSDTHRERLIRDVKAVEVDAQVIIIETPIGCELKVDPWLGTVASGKTAVASIHESNLNKGMIRSIGITVPSGTAVFAEDEAFTLGMFILRCHAESEIFIENGVVVFSEKGR